MAFKNVKNAGIALASLAMALSPAIAQASTTGHGKPEGTHGKGSTQRSESGSKHAGGAENHGKRGHSRAKCMPHGVAYIASGTLVSDTLTKSETANTYSGEVIVEVTHANHHARSAVGQTETYTVQNAHVKGSVAVASLTQGDHARLFGKITTVARKCEPTSSTGTITITKLAFHSPKATTGQEHHV